MKAKELIKALSELDEEDQELEVVTIDANMYHITQSPVIWCKDKEANEKDVVII